MNWQAENLDLSQIDTDEAELIIDFLARLGDELWVHHGERIAEQRCKEIYNDHQLKIDFDDVLPD
jgi:hypothetical protein